jgi:hypothetical protein
VVKLIQILALIVGISTYLFWNIILKKFGIPVFYIGNALFIFLLCVLNYILSYKNVISFSLICLSFSNLLDEIFFDNTKISLNEIILALILPIVWLIIQKRNAGKINTK